MRASFGPVHRGPRPRPAQPLRGEAALQLLEPGVWTVVAYSMGGRWHRTGNSGLWADDVAGLVAAGVALSAQRRGGDGRMELLVQPRLRP